MNAEGQTDTKIEGWKGQYVTDGSLILKVLNVKPAHFWAIDLRWNKTIKVKLPAKNFFRIISEQEAIKLIKEKEHKLTLGDTTGLTVLAMLGDK